MRISPKVPSPTTPAASAPRPSDAELSGQIYERMSHVNLSEHILKQPPNTKGMRQVAVGSNQQAFLDTKGNFYVKVTYPPNAGPKESGYWAGPIALKPPAPPKPPSPPPVSDAALKTQILNRLPQVNLSNFVTPTPPDTMKLRHVVVDDRLNSGGPKQEAYVDPSRNQFYMRVTYNPSLGMNPPGYWSGPIPLK